VDRAKIYRARQVSELSVVENKTKHEFCINGNGELNGSNAERRGCENNRK
jgi:hypothetical protein